MSNSLVYKKIKTLIPVFPVQMGEVTVQQSLPTQKVPQIDPFLLLHHAIFNFDSRVKAIYQGLGPHPHRGFTPVTFVIKGEVHHRDSRGNSQIAKEGEVQWMHAGAGIIHSERPSQDLVDSEGAQEIIQLWINSPAHKKMEIPNYQYVTKPYIPTITSKDTLVQTKVIAGTQQNIKGVFTSESELLILWSNFKRNGRDTFTIPTDFNCCIYVINGTITIKGYGIIEEQTLAVFNTEGSFIEITATSKASLLILAGKPIKEKIVQQGPFVMNTETEILEAMRDYKMGKMGILIED